VDNKVELCGVKEVSRYCRIDALAGFGPAVGLAFLAGVLVIGVAVVLGPFAFAFMRISETLSQEAGGRNDPGVRQPEREQRGKEQHSHRGSSVRFLGSSAPGAAECAISQRAPPWMR